MIIEGIVTTQNEHHQLNIAPMGPIVDESMTQLVLRPFRTSTTYRNLTTRPFGVFHVVDDVLLIAQAALDRFDQQPSTVTAERIEGQVLTDCCRWYEFEITARDDANERASFTANVVHQGRRRDMFGFNRAKHAVLEATILATRLHLIPETELRTQLTALSVIVQKTAGPREHAALSLIADYVEQWYLSNVPRAGS